MTRAAAKSRNAGGSALGAAAQQLRYLAGRRPWPIELPVVVQFPVNDICDSKCQMCNIWQQKRDREISADEVRRLFANPLFRNVRTVGFNGGEPTLRRDLADLGCALFDALPRLRALSLITNGLHAERAMQRIDELADVAAERGVRFDVMVSLDGVGEVHDRVRGVPGNFEEAVRVLDHVRARPERIAARVGCTVIRDNVFGLHELYDFCVDRGVYVKYRLGVPNRRLYNLEPAGPRQIGKRTWIDTHPFGLDEEQRWHFAQFLNGLVDHYEPSLAQAQFYQSLSAQVLRGHPRRAGCDWQHRGVTVGSRGEILYCAVQSKVLGDGLTANPHDLYFGNQGYLESIVRDKCATCAHDYVGPPGGAQQVQLLADRALGFMGSSLAQARRSAPVEALMAVKRSAIDPVRFALHRRRQIADASVAVRSGARRHEVLICGWYGTETLGDKAILAAVVGAIRGLEPTAGIVIASLDPACTRLTVAQMAELSGCEVIDVSVALDRVAQSRALVFGGGPLMAIREMALMESLFVRARAAGVPSIVAGCGVGPLGPSAYNQSIRGLLAAATHRIFRDEQSRALAARELSLSVDGDAVCDDPAATWLQGFAVRKIQTASAPTLVLGLRDWPYRQYAPQLSDADGERVRREFERSVAAALERVVNAAPDLRILPIPFCTHAIGGDDRWLYWRLLRLAPQLRAHFERSLLSRELTPAEYVERIRGANAALTMRFHSLVFASMLGVPVVAVDYTGGRGKTHSLGQRIGCPVYPIESVEADVLASSLQAALAARGNEPPPIPGFGPAFSHAWRASVGPASSGQR